MVFKISNFQCVTVILGRLQSILYRVFSDLSGTVTKSSEKHKVILLLLSILTTEAVLKVGWDDTVASNFFSGSPKMISLPLQFPKIMSVLPFPSHFFTLMKTLQTKYNVHKNFGLCFLTV